MFPRGDLRHDAAKRGMSLDLRVNEIGEYALPVFYNSRRGFIA